MRRRTPWTKIRALVHAWLVLDFFGDARRAGNEHGSSLTTTIFSQSFLAFVFAALLYPDVAPVPFAAANLGLSTLLVAIGTLGDEERPQRRTADAHLLATAPVGRTAIVLARCGHGMFHVGLVTIGMALAPAILLAFLQDDWKLLPGYVAFACLCSGLATGLLALAGMALARAAGAARAALAMGTLKALLLGGGLVLFATSLRRLDATAEALPIGRIGAELLPPYHAARLLADPTGQWWRLLLLLGLAVVLGVAAILATGTLPSNRTRVARSQPLQALLGRISGRGPRRAVAAFVAISMWRSAGFRARVLPLLGLPAGMALLTLGGGTTGQGFALSCALLQLPAIYLPFLIAFLPRADQPDAEWVFGHAPRLSLDTVQDATWRALVTHVLLPVHALALVLVLLLSADRWQLLPASVFALGVGALAARRMVRQLPCVSFTDRSEQEGGLDLGSLFASALLLGGLGAAFGFALPPGWRWPVAITAAAVAGALLRPQFGMPRQDGEAGAPRTANDSRTGVAQQGEGAEAATSAGGGSGTAAPAGAGAARHRTPHGKGEGGGTTPAGPGTRASAAAGAPAVPSTGAAFGEAPSAEPPGVPPPAEGGLPVAGESLGGVPDSGSFGGAGTDRSHEGGTEHEAPPPPPKPTLARELRAIAVLYAALCLLPWLVGTVFAA